MRKLPGTIQSGKITFPPTRWSVVGAFAEERGPLPPQARAALEELCRDYWPPLYNFVRRRGYDSHDAQDLVQGFFAALLENDAYTRADRARGKFRAFLLTALKHYLADERARQDRLKRGGGQRVVAIEDESVTTEERSLRDLAVGPRGEEEQFFERSWALVTVARALDGLGAEFDGNEREAQTFAALRPFLAGGAELPDQRTVAEDLGVPVENLRNQISRLRTRYRAALRREVVRTLASEEDAEEELRYLLRVLLKTV